MTHAASLDQATRATIARDVGKHFSQPLSLSMPHRQVALGAEFKIAESLPVYMLGANAIGDPPRRLQDAARATGNWHHQIKLGRRATHTAQSTADGKVLQVVASPAASSIDQTIAWIDRHVDGDPRAQLLFVPAYLTTAIWLKYPRADEIVVALMPKRLRGNLEMRHVYSFADFCSALRALPPVTMGPDPAAGRKPGKKAARRSKKRATPG